MAITDLLNQTITLYTRTSYNKYGKMQVGSGTNYNARVQLHSKQKLLPNGQVIDLLATVYVAPTVTVAQNDKVTYDGVDYKVYQKYETVDGAGIANHIKLELIKWQE